MAEGKELPPDILYAVIAAAVQAVIDEPFRIVSIDTGSHGTSIWNIHGRLQQFESHRFR
ncbi:MAG TPA: hypothetical protein VN931_03345 [Fibrobacteria bacterium]|nr:hypothetical protein [Fibrobacteria bacterium]